ncbi:MAG: DMT family transporter [Actinomycetota bacterium]
MKNRYAYITVFVTMALWGSYGVFQRWVGLAGSEQHIILMRNLMGLSVILAVALLSRRMGQLAVKKHWPLMIGSGVAASLSMLFSAKAISLLPLSHAIFLAYLSTVIAAFLAPLILKEKLEPVTYVALVIAVGGLALISFSQKGASGKEFNFNGVVYGVLAACCYAALIITLKAMRERLPTIAASFYPGVVSVLIMLPLTGFGLPKLDGRGWASMMVIGFLFSGVFVLIYVWAAKYVKAQHLGIVSYTDPLSATLCAYLFLGESPSWQGIVGGALIVTAGLLVIMKAGAGPAGDEPAPP